ncbi:RagB/SusD family nutrient uptake outer membrane protein [Zobellia uliginosa]|uniref:RagB/SusD family nutrient uptake outer membrane protein n=1 Tax=Zobellia uliginosa TaxID=143224 RepID=UPI0026E308A9|nr:RagB/SusD family nutrient uptake outer membrane protein [Zobellia uliginosa]MDO6519366.1 RagB/SusD family nutrient uptake outer membrane protein [Zobellia uliginosa]
MKKYIKLGLIVLVSFTLVNCSDDKFFELERPQLFPWNNVGELELSVVDSYAAFFLNQGWAAPNGGLAYRDFVISDISVASKHQPLEHEAVFYYERNFESALVGGEEDGQFAQLYRCLNQILPALTFIEEQEAKGEEVFSGMTDNDRQTLAGQKGELYFMRAWVNYFLVRTFMPPFDPNGDNSAKFLPLKLSYEESQDGLRNADLGSVKDFYDLIISDLEKAKSLLPEQHSEPGRANKYVASTMLYRVGFLMGNHEAALAECDFIIKEAVEAKGYYDLSEDPIEVWDRNFGDAPAKESIWEVPLRAESENNDIPFARMTKIGYYRANGGGRGENWSQGWAGTMALSHNMLEKIGWMDPATKTPTPEALSDKRFNQVYYFLLAGKDKPEGLEGDAAIEADTLYDSQQRVTDNHIWVDKYYRAEEGRYSQLPLVRLAEIYLSRAMLRYSVNNDVIGATADINTVRERAGLPTVATVTEETIEAERLKELAGEAGDRLLYLKGYQKSIDGNRIDNGQAIPAIAPPYSNAYRPLPLGESDYNGNYNN